MKLIFLDCDGVLNSVLDRFSWTLETDRHFEILKDIVDITDAQIVLSSAWRLSTRGKYIASNRLKEFGMKLIGSTPYLPNQPRGDEIDKFMKDFIFDIESFVILDDESDMQEFTKTNLVKTDMWVGLTETDAKKAIEILNGE